MQGMTEKISQAQHIVDKFGGVRPLAKLLGHRHPTTVQGWLESGYIPPRRYDELFAAAAAADVDLRYADFFVNCNPSTAAE